jgi:kumamolisin
MRGGVCCATMRGLAIVALAVGLSWAAPAAAAPPRITFYFGLERPEGAARTALAAVGDPSSTTYRSFLTASQAAGRYGASLRTVRVLRSALRTRGLSTRVDRSRVFARVTGTPRQFERLLGLRISKSFDNDVNADGWSPAGKGRPRLPADVRPLVREVVAFYARSTKPQPAAAEIAGAPQPGQPGNAGTWIGGCAAARATGAYAFEQVRTAYGLDSVGTGAGGSVAIVNLGEGVPRADVATLARCFGQPGIRTRTLLTDGQGKAFGRGSFEPQEDLAMARGMAPGLASLTFSQAWLAQQVWFLGPAQVLAAPNLPDSLSISYGQCERLVRGRRADPSSRAGARLMDAILVRLGLVGVSAFASAGDFGSTCNGQPYPGVAWPASSPFLTAVGGSRLVVNAANARVDEVVWNDLEWLSTDNGGGAGGGGFASASRRQAYQAGLALPGRLRAVPDVAAHASMLPGWPVVISRSWVEDAGTSAAAPLMAGAFAVLSARERAVGRPPLGPVNGLLYATAAQTAFDIVSGDNGYDRRVPARSAGPGYDLASGLGVPRFDVLAGALPAPR